MKKSILVLSASFLLLAVQAFQVQTRKQDTATAKHFISMMNKGEFKLVQSIFDTTMKQAAPEWKLRAIWTSFAKEAGKLTRELRDTTFTYGGYEIVVVTCEFENFTQDIRVVFDKGGQIAGFFFAARHAKEENGEKHSQLGGSPKGRAGSPAGTTNHISKDVTFKNEKANVTLAGTLTLPDSGSDFPAVLLVSGSGPNDRNETVAGHEIFRTLADYLTGHGIAVLRYDKRGVGESTGDYKTATTEDFASDALAGVSYLMNLRETDHEEIGLIGHSEGGEIAPIVADESPDVAFVVLMGAPGVPGYETIMDQVAAMARASGASDSSVNAELSIEKRFLDIVMSNKDSSSAAMEIVRLLVKEAKQDTSEAELAAGEALSPWYRAFISYNPAPALRKLKCPVLALWGSKDLQVPPSKNLPEVEKELKVGGNQDIKLIEIPGLNHLFQDAKTGLPSEYGMIKEDISPRALAFISNWILDRSRTRK